MQKIIQDLGDFHSICDVEEGYTNLKDVPKVIYDLRLRLLEEEFYEYKEAHLKYNKVEMADALADLIYIAVGTARVFDIPLEEVWKEVQRSNMSKKDLKTGKIVKRKDGKVLKPATWTPPNIEKIIKDYEKRKSSKSF